MNPNFIILFYYFLNEKVVKHKTTNQKLDGFLTERKNDTCIGKESKM